MKALVLIVGILCSSVVAEDTVPEFQRGDADGDGQLCMSDAILLVYHLWRDGRPLPCMDAADANDDGSIDVGDVLASLYAVFHGLPLPPPVLCGADPTPDYLSCDNPGACNSGAYFQGE